MGGEHKAKMLLFELGGRKPTTREIALTVKTGGTAALTEADLVASPQELNSGAKEPKGDEASQPGAEYDRPVQRLGDGRMRADRVHNQPGRESDTDDGRNERGDQNDDLEPWREVHAVLTRGAASRPRSSPFG